MRGLLVEHVQGVLLDPRGWCDAVLELRPLDVWQLFPVVRDDTPVSFLSHFRLVVYVERVCSSHMSRRLRLDANRDLTTAQVVSSYGTSALSVVT
jgi:hypothetical protein